MSVARLFAVDVCGILSITDYIRNELFTCFAKGISIFCAYLFSELSMAVRRCNSFKYCIHLSTTGWCIGPAHYEA